MLLPSHLTQSKSQSPHNDPQGPTYNSKILPPTIPLWPPLPASSKPSQPTGWHTLTLDMLMIAPFLKNTSLSYFYVILLQFLQVFIQVTASE